MYQYRIRIRNLLLQKMYKPRRGKSRFISAQAMEALEEIERRIEDTITPLLADLFE